MMRTFTFVLLSFGKQIQVCEQLLKGENIKPTCKYSEVHKRWLFKIIIDALVDKVGVITFKKEL